MGDILEKIKEGIARDLGFRKWSNNNLLRCVFAAWPQAVKQYVK